MFDKIEPENGELRIAAAEWPRDASAVSRLFESYFQSLRDDPAVPESIRARDRRAELHALGTRYDNTSAALLLAWSGDRVCGCATTLFLPSRDRSAEMKRLYVLPEARGRGAGRALILACAAWAREHGARELLLDTLPGAMPDAVRLYCALGFTPTERYNDNVGPEFAFFRLDLR